VTGAGVADLELRLPDPRGQRDDYALDPKPIGRGGQAEVFGATDKPSGTLVAFKRLRSPTEESLARMRREVEVCRQLDDVPHVMPILDVSVDGAWFVMPLAAGNLETQRGSLRRSEDLVGMLEQLLQALDRAHAEGYVHRDIKPANVLLLAPGQWVVADWGLVRRPRGLTSVDGRTIVGRSYGTAGFAAPELATDAHAAGPAADIYSIGQLIGWVVTGRDPVANVPLIPTSSTWAGVVRDCTRGDPNRRPGSAADVLTMIRDELGEPPVPAAHRGEEILIELDELSRSPGTGRGAEVRRLIAELLRVSVANPSDEILLDVLPRLTEAQVDATVRVDGGAVREVVTAYRTHAPDFGRRDFNWANEVIRLFLRIARAAAQRGDLDLFEEATDLMFDWDNDWDRWKVQSEINRWLKTLQGDHARSVARILRRFPDSCRHFEELGDDRSVDLRIRNVLRQGAE